jgi:hypothetical protein
LEIPTPTPNDGFGDGSFQQFIEEHAAIPRATWGDIMGGKMTATAYNNQSYYPKPHSTPARNINKWSVYRNESVDAYQVQEAITTGDGQWDTAQYYLDKRWPQFTDADGEPRCVVPLFTPDFGPNLGHTIAVFQVIHEKVHKMVESAEEKTVVLVYNENILLPIMDGKNLNYISAGSKSELRMWVDVASFISGNDTEHVLDHVVVNEATREVALCDEDGNQWRGDWETNVKPYVLMRYKK